MTAPAMANQNKAYLPAAGRDFLLPLYDVITKLMGADRARAVLLNDLRLRPGQRVLDIGCGTGTLAVAMKQIAPDAEIVGLDPDPKALRRAARKAEEAGVRVQFDRGFADELPYVDAAFDDVCSSYMFHHLEQEQREKALREIRRVLKRGGVLHLVDFAGPEHGKHWVTRWFHAHDRLKDNGESSVTAMMTHAGFASAKVIRRGAVLGGLAGVTYFEAS